ncbi:hypothetical protein AA309_19140 [Microvirga vignae]|uniref:Uncharacterized protein n=1 Tax=Microvirga vignae TaxID=1225564 RepID=A0A0H1R8X6_9HYPH|nr:hypothetical protein AA309_19140 [Microvirga vignae]
MERAMCHYCGSYMSEEKARAEADRQKELEAKHTQAVDRLLHEADQTAQTAAPASEKEPIPAK